MATVNVSEQTAYKGKVIVVTGAASGIGRALAQNLAAAGAHVVAADPDVVSAKNAIAKFPKCYATECDETNPDSRRSLLNHCINKLGHIDAVVNSQTVLGTIPIANPLDVHA